jgi:hypothetical protein
MVLFVVRDDSKVVTSDDLMSLEFGLHLGLPGAPGGPSLWQAQAADTDYSASVM